jgi:hypothetical protein
VLLRIAWFSQQVCSWYWNIRFAACCSRKQTDQRWCALIFASFFHFGLPSNSFLSHVE